MESSNSVEIIKRKQKGEEVYYAIKGALFVQLEAAAPSVSDKCCNVYQNIGNVFKNHITVIE